MACLALMLLTDKKYGMCPPGAAHEARFMASCIYLFKMIAIKNLYEICDKIKLKKLEKFVTFLAIYYVPYFLRSSLLIQAPSLDLQFYRDVEKLRKSDSSYRIICDAVIKSISKLHNYYLSEENVILSLCDRNVSYNDKEEISIRACQMKKDDIKSTVTLKPLFPNMKKISKLSDCAGEKSLLFFDLFNIETDFLLENPESWNTNKNFKIFESCVQSLLCVNDPSERNIALAQRSIELARSEEKIQHVFKIRNKVQAEIPKKTLNNKTTVANYFKVM